MNQDHHRNCRYKCFIGITSHRRYRSITGTTLSGLHYDLDNVPTNASRVVFLMIPEFPSGYTYGYNYAYIDDVEIRDIPNCPIAVNAEGNATSDSSVTNVGR